MLFFSTKERRKFTLHEVNIKEEINMNTDLPSKNISNRMPVGTSFTPTSVSHSSDFPTHPAPYSTQEFGHPKRG